MHSDLPLRSEIGTFQLAFEPEPEPEPGAEKTHSPAVVVLAVAYADSAAGGAEGSGSDSGIAAADCRCYYCCYRCWKLEVEVGKRCEFGCCWRSSVSSANLGSG
jgi:hypothetical protein